MYVSETLSSCFFVLKVMVPVNYKEFINDLTYLVKNNVIPMDRIDDAVGRILLVKFTMGLFENPFGDLSLVNELGSQVRFLFAYFMMSICLLCSWKNRMQSHYILCSVMIKFIVQWQKPIS